MNHINMTFIHTESVVQRSSWSKKEKKSIETCVCGKNVHDASSVYMAFVKHGLHRDEASHIIHQFWEEKSKFIKNGDIL